MSNSSESAGGIYFDAHSVRIADNLILRNRARGSAGGLYGLAERRYAHGVVVNNTVVDNAGGGMAF